MHGRLRVYGQFNSYWSNCNVSRGLVAGLVKNGLDVEIHDESYTFVETGKLGATEAWGPATPMAAFVGYPALAQRLIPHQFKIGFYIAESSILPPPWAVMLAATDLVVAPSRWMAEVFTRNGARPETVRIVPHGLDPVYGVVPGLRALPKEFLRFLHVAGARDFLHRKGTFVLIEAFARVFGRKDAPKAKLTLRIPGPCPAVQQVLDKTGRKDLFILDAHTEPLSPHQMRSYYLSTPWAAIIQPSRAEAFGLVPLEARALGFPVILSDCTGHRQHIEPQDTLVISGPEAEMKANGILEGRAPIITVEAIENALEFFLQNQVQITHRAARGAAGYYDKWMWPILTRKLAEELKHVARGLGKSQTPGEKLGLE